MPSMAATNPTIYSLSVVAVHRQRTYPSLDRRTDPKWIQVEEPSGKVRQELDYDMNLEEEVLYSISKEVVSCP